MGEGSVIGGNTFIIKSVPSGTIVNNKAVMRFKYSKTFKILIKNELNKNRVSIETSLTTHINLQQSVFHNPLFDDLVIKNYIFHKDK